jgi:4,5-dihydroxyphthalate decarboxylase
VSRLPLSLAISHYDHVTDLVTGRVPVEGVDLTALTLQVEEIFFRTFTYRDFDVSEVSLAKHSSLISQGDSPFVGIPVFPSRVTRHSSIYVRRDGPVREPRDLVGKRVGLPEWAQTASVYSRGLLMHHYGVELNLPKGVTVTSASDKSLSGMLVAGEIDAALTAHPPACFEERHPNITRLFQDYLDVEMRYVRETGIFPIMHTVAIRKELVEKYPWIAMNLFKAFDEAKRRSVERMLFIGIAAVPIPWCAAHAQRAQELFGDDIWPYGIEPNRTTLDAFLQYAFEQGVCHRRLAPEDLFATQVQRSVRV